MSDLELRNKIRCTIKFCYQLVKIAPETVKLMKETFKDKCFGESTVFRWYGDFKKGRLSTNFALKLSQPENVVKGRNVNTVWTILQENRRMTCQEIIASTNKPFENIVVSYSTKFKGSLHLFHTSPSSPFERTNANKNSPLQ